MSLILKGIDLPEANEIRMIAINSNGEAFFNMVKDGAPDKTEISQAIQIPTPHGRLIDADAFVKDFTQNYEECRDVGYFSSEESERIAGVVATGVALDVNNAPTILESEE